MRNQEEPSADADEMARDFIQLVDDLAYAKTFYPSGKVTRYINTQASKIYLNIYKNRKEESNRLIGFWKYDLPLTIRRHYISMLFCFILFVLFFAVGFFSSIHDPGFVRDVLGDSYVDNFNAADTTIPCLFQVRNSILVQNILAPTEFKTVLDYSQTGVNRTPVKAQLNDDTYFSSSTFVT